MTPQPNGVATAADQAHRRAREDREEDLHPRAATYPQPAFDKALAECKADKTWQTFETTTAGHDVMIDEPAWLAEILLKVA